MDTDGVDEDDMRFMNNDYYDNSYTGESETESETDDEWPLHQFGEDRPTESAREKEEKEDGVGGGEEEGMKQEEERDGGRRESQAESHAALNASNGSEGSRGVSGAPLSRGFEDWMAGEQARKQQSSASLRGARAHHGSGGLGGNGGAHGHVTEEVMGQVPAWGLTWCKVGTVRPTSGRQLLNPTLAGSLCLCLSMSVSLARLSLSLSHKVSLALSRARSLSLFSSLAPLSPCTIASLPSLLLFLSIPPSLPLHQRWG